MKVMRSTQARLLAALEAISGTADQKGPGIRGSAKLEKTGSVLQITGVSGQIEISVDAELGGSSESLITTLPTRKLIEILRSIPSGDVVTLEHAGDRLTVISGAFEVHLRVAQLSELLPPMSEESPNIAFEMPSISLKKLIDQVHFSIPAEDYRHRLVGAFLRVKDSTMTMAGTNGSRLAVAWTGVATGVVQAEVTLPRRAVVELQRLLTTSSEPVKVQLTDRQAHFKFGNLSVRSVLLADEFPKFTPLVEATCRHRLEVPRAALMTGLRRATAMTDKFRGVRLLLRSRRLTLSTLSNPLGESVEEIAVHYDGPDAEVGFDVRYLSESASNHVGNTLVLAYSEVQSPWKVTDSGEGGLVHIIQPMRI